MLGDGIDRARALVGHQLELALERLPLGLEFADHRVAALECVAMRGLLLLESPKQLCLGRRLARHALVRIAECSLEFADH